MGARLKFEYEWMDPAGAAGPELRATWARLVIAVGDCNITANVDEQNRILRDSVILPLYPIAEWIATNWWVLLGEPYNEKRERGYHARHSFVDGSEGFAVPDLTLNPEGEQILARWEGRQSQWSQVRFIDKGAASLDREDVEGELRRLVALVVARLEAEGVEGTLLQDEWQAINRLDGEEKDFCAAVGRLGRDPFNLPERDANAIITATEDWDQATVAEVFSAIDSSNLTDTFNQLGSFRRRLEQHTDRFDKLSRFRDQRAGTIAWARRDPWQIGYDCARRLRSWLGGEERVGTTTRWDRILGVDAKAWSWDDHLAARLRGVECLLVQDEGRFAFGAAHNSSSSHSRFLRYRAVFEMITANTEAPIAVVSTAISARQKANRAFAAEFLAPAAALKGHFARHEVSYDSIADVAKRFGVSTWLIAHQLENHGIVQRKTLAINPFQTNPSPFGVKLDFDT